MAQYIAHKTADDGNEQRILTHLSETAMLSSRFAEGFDAEDTAKLCGQCHDIGKYSDAFQRRIRGSTEQVDHSTAGAKELFERRDLLSAFCVAGHHSGIPDLGTRFDAETESTLLARMKRPLQDYSAFRSEVTLPTAAHPPAKIQTPQACFFYTHMLFSCLVDADYLNTEQFMSPQTERGTFDDLAVVSKRLDDFLMRKGWLCGETGLNRLRSEILCTVQAKAQQSAGLFTLTVPTGGGKTIASMAFALRHAIAHGMQRVIYVIPYCSILEQTQSIFESIFGVQNVIAHYATVDYGSTDESICSTRMLAAENWDAPIILTTSVQFFESLYGNRPSQCRKLHNIANSVMIFDEAQMLPVPFLRPCVHAISTLVQQYGCSGVLCTATQPSLAPILQAEGYRNQICELCPQPLMMYTAFRRVQYAYLGNLDNDALADRLNREQSVLCIVNNRAQAQALFALLQGEGRFHLSTAMIPLHRRMVLDEIRSRLLHGLPCKVVSTSLVEAGVDLDFPIVYRAMAGLDSILQAGGRCNREGKHAIEDSTVYFFDSETKAPRALWQGIAASEYVVRQYPDIAAPNAIEAYFQFLFYRMKSDSDLDAEGILADAASGKFPFASVAKRFHLIRDDACTIYVPLGEGAALTDLLLQGAPLSRRQMRTLGQYGVSVYPQLYQSMLAQGKAVMVADGVAVLSDLSLYQDALGLPLKMNEGEGLFC